MPGTNLPGTNLPGTDLGVALPEDAVDRRPEIAGIEAAETPPRYADHVIPLTAITAAFLVAGLAFAARLFDAIGNPISGRQLTALAAWGWGFAGVALTLLVWGSIILPRAHRSRWPLWQTGVAVLLSAIICCEAVYLAGPGLTEDLADRMSTTGRRCAVQLRVLAEARQDDAATPSLQGIQAALLRAPFAGLTCDAVADVSRQALSQALQGLVAWQLGTAEHEYDTVFIPSVRSLRDAYNEYVVAQLRLVAGISDIRSQQARAWQQYLDRLAHARLSPARVKRRDRPRIEAEVRDMGVQVPSGWNPTDQSTFMEAVATASRQSADAAYNDFIEQRFQEPLPPGLGWDSFCSQPGIQKHWRAAIDASPETPLTPNMGFAAYRQAVYQPRVERLVQPALNNLMASPSAFAPIGRQGEAAHAAVYWVIVPALLIAVTLGGILWHTTRLVGLSWQILLPRGVAWKRWATEACIAAVVAVLLAWQVPGTCFDLAGSCRTGVVEHALRAIGSGLRNTVFVGFDFGYSPPSARDLSGTRLEPLLPPLPSG